jgi:hypothetical protein
MRTERDAFRLAMDKHVKAGEIAWETAKDKLENNWEAFEANVQKYVESVGEHVEQRRWTFHARADAQGKAWRESANELREMAKHYASDRRSELESAIARMKSEADAAEAKLHEIKTAGANSWSAFQTALAESRAAFDRANRIAHDAFSKAKSSR